MKTTKRILITVALAGLMAGCATHRDNTGGMGNGNQVASGSGSGGNMYVAPRGPAPMGPNGSIGSGNPFGQGPGNIDY